MSEQEDNMRGPKPAAILRDGALKISIFRNQNEYGENYAMVPGRIYTDKQTSEVRETTSLSQNEGLRMAHLLTKGFDRVSELREQAKLTNGKEQQPEKEKQPERDQRRER